MQDPLIKRTRSSAPLAIPRKLYAMHRLWCHDETIVSSSFARSAAHGLPHFEGQSFCECNPEWNKPRAITAPRYFLSAFSIVRFKM